jgi:hypothetical protein
VRITVSFFVRSSILRMKFHNRSLTHKNGASRLFFPHGGMKARTQPLICGGELFFATLGVCKLVVEFLPQPAITEACRVADSTVRTIEDQEQILYRHKKRRILRSPLEKPNACGTPWSVLSSPVPPHKKKRELLPRGSAFVARRARHRVLARDPIASLKKESYRVQIGVSSENLGQRARLELASGLTGSARLARSREPALSSGKPHRDRSAAREQEGSYLAINWQRMAIQVRVACIGRRFPTPLQRQNTAEIRPENGSAVTTNHLLLPSQRGKAAFLLPISEPNFDFLNAKCSGCNEGGGGGSARRNSAKASYR